MSAADIARALRGHRSGEAWLCHCPGPSHQNGDRHPSLLLKDGDTALLVTCFAGCERRDVLDALRRRGILDDAPARDRSAPVVRRDPLSEPEPDPTALALWRDAVLIGGTIGETYLRRTRCLSLPLPPSLRFAVSTPYRSAEGFGAMVAAVQRPDRQVVAVQAAFLTADGRKAPLDVPRLTVGRLGSGAVRLAAAGDVLGLAEGVETALSAMELSSVPCWAVLGARRLGNVTLPENAREVHLFVDNDEAGRLGADKAVERFTATGRRVVVRRPPSEFKDWNDALRARQAVAA